ncbi:MAG: hypothetical protein KGI27_10950 [Thaumarchaeota archaeon]|nr:hypothetical protein [Nitrososphaerota archaeon]
MNIWYPIVIVAFLAMVSVSSHAYASTCAVKQTTLTTPQQFYRVSDVVFVGTISEINNYTNQQYKIQFDAEKIWKGAQTTKITLTAGSLQACGYSLVKDEKYLVFANGSPPSLDLVLTKPFTEAQDFISVYNDTQFQSEESAKESMIKRLENAKDAISAMMGSHNTSGIPFNMVGVDVLNATLDVGIDSSKAALTKAGYEEKIKGLVGDLPMDVEFMQIWPTTGNTSHEQITNSTPNNHPVLHADVKYVLRSPLQQFKSGIKAEDVKCSDGFTLVIKSEDGSPACVKSRSAAVLILHGWARQSHNGEIVYFMKSNSTGKLTVEYNLALSHEQSVLNARIYNGGSMSQIQPSIIEAQVNPSIISGNSNTTVVYTIISHETKGVYWLSLDACGFVPIVVDLDNSEITKTDLQPSLSGLRCPVSLLQYKIVGFEGIDPQYVGIEK